MRSFSTRRAALFVLLALIILIWAAARRGKPPESPPAPGPRQQDIAAQIAFETRQLREAEQRVAESVWKQELLAQQCGSVIDDFWDALNRSTNKLGAAVSLNFETLVLPRFGKPESLPNGIQLFRPEGAAPALSRQSWAELVDRSARAGWHLVQTEFRHAAFNTDTSGLPSKSVFNFSAHLTNASGAAATLEGDLAVTWAGNRSNGIPPAIFRVDAGGLRLSTHAGPRPFTRILCEEISPPEGSFFIDPLIVYDLDSDGASEIVLAAKNLVYRRAGDTFAAEPLCKFPPGLIFAGCIADFTGDGNPDFLCAKFEGLELFAGDARGRFEQPGRIVWRAAPRLKYVNVLAPADVDRDGDIDIFLGQYKMPYERGAMPTPFYDANDGHPAYLLLNDGSGGFTDRTTASGLGPKRWRHTYSGSFCDFDNDGLPDLAVVNDFAGLDLWKNEGRGRFADATDEWVHDSRAFGMGHAIADFNVDGRLDLLMLGMPSPTVDRLEHLGLRRPDDRADPSMRARMSYGNRLYLAQPQGGFVQTAMSDAIARSGWSWGCAAFDVENDGFPDVYIANGHESKESVREYEPHYWLHDIFVGSSRDDPVAFEYFRAKIGATRGKGHSYGGYDKNRLYLNRGGRDFFEAGHLFGLALEQDSRNVVADDLDADGRVDLVVTTFEAWPVTRQTLQVFKNITPASGNWVGFRFREEGKGRSPVGLTVTLQAGPRKTVRAVGLSDSYRSQHPLTARFGLGDLQALDEAQIRWADGETHILKAPAINRVHNISFSKGQ